MKKLISVLLVVSMLMSFSVIAFAENSTVKNGDIIFFGNYPQTLVTDNSLIKKLDKAPKKWVSYEHYYHYTNEEGKAISGNKKITDNMQYADFSYEGINYRGVNFVRPSMLISGDHFPNEDLYPRLDWTNEVYYFKYEPISWIVVDAENRVVVSQKALDQQEFNKTYYYDESNKKCYKNESMSYTADNYTVSDLREWLNNDFIDSAFTFTQKKKILTNTYELDEYYTFTDGYYSKNIFVEDYVAIPSSREFKKFGFNPISMTDYAYIQGSGGQSVTTRTIYESGFADKSSIEAISADTFAESYILPINNANSIVPMMKLSSLSNNTDMPLFENGSKCSCLCHNLEHEDNFFAEFIRNFIFELWSIFSIKQYCKCDLRHY